MIHKDSLRMQQLASSSLFDYSRETSSADVYTGTAYYMQSQSVRYIDILYISVREKIDQEQQSVWINVRT